MPDDTGRVPARPPPARWQVMVTMNEHGQVHIAQSTPSADVTAMLLYRAVTFIEQELLRARLQPDDRPRIQLPGPPR